MKEKILELREEGYSYREIEKKLNCSKGTIAYHCGEGQKSKTRERSQKRRAQLTPLGKKIEGFKYRHIPKKVKNATDKFQLREPSWSTAPRQDRKCYAKTCKTTFKPRDVIEKFGDQPQCYLSGRQINWDDPESYWFDHVVPVSEGGKNTLDNLQLAHPQANYAKHNLDEEELLKLCKDILVHHGYKVTK